MGAVNQATEGSSGDWTPRRVSLANFREISTTAIEMLFKPVRRLGLFLSFFLFALLFEPLFSLFSLIFLLLSLSFFLSFGRNCRVAGSGRCSLDRVMDPAYQACSSRQATPSTAWTKRVLVFLGPVLAYQSQFLLASLLRA